MFSRYSGRPVLTQSGLYDPTTILETERIATCQRESWAKLVIYTVIFFYSLAGWDKKIYNKSAWLPVYEIAHPLCFQVCDVSQYWAVTIKDCSHLTENLQGCFLLVACYTERISFNLNKLTGHSSNKIYYNIMDTILIYSTWQSSNASSEGIWPLEDFFLKTINMDKRDN